MTGFIIICVIVVLLAFLTPRDYLWGAIGTGNSDLWSEGRKHLYLWIGTALLIIVWICVKVDFPNMKIPAIILTALFYIVSISRAKCSVVEYFIAGSLLALITMSLNRAGAYEPYESEGGYELRSKYTYWLTRKKEAVGKDWFKFEIIGRVGSPSKAPDRVKVYGLRDKTGAIHIPGICDFPEGFTNFTIEHYQGESDNAEVLHLKRPDGRGVYRDIYGKNTKEEDYRQPTYVDAPMENIVAE